MALDAFDSRQVLSAIRTLASADPLTIIVGAGVSVESGLPSWERLVSSLLVAAGKGAELSRSEARGFDEWTRSREDLTGAGEVARQLFKPNDFRESLTATLYADGDEPLPGETASAVAALRTSAISNRDLEIVTTNYDRLLEASLKREIEQRSLKGWEVVTSTDQSDFRDGVLGIRHLHGVLSTGGKQWGKLVLSDRDYHLMQQESAWQEELLQERLRSTTCLFVGTSLTDPNLLRYLYRANHDRDHFAIFVRQDDADLYDASSESVRKLRESSQARKWQAVRIEPVVLDYYALSAQFVWEVCAATRGSSYVTLPERLREWRTSLGSGVLSLDTPEFQRNQELLHGLLVKALDGVMERLRSNSHRRSPGERIGMSLWVYEPGEEKLVNWASADRVWRDPETLEPVPIDWASDFVATRAFCSGSMVSLPTRKYVTSRWNHVIGFPVYLHRPEGRLPVGSITLASTIDADRSFLARREGVVRNDLIPELADIVDSLLDPWA